MAGTMVAGISGSSNEHVRALAGWFLAKESDANAAELSIDEEQHRLADLHEEFLALAEKQKERYQIEVRRGRNPWKAPSEATSRRKQERRQAADRSRQRMSTLSRSTAPKVSRPLAPDIPFEWQIPSPKGAPVPPLLSPLPSARDAPDSDAIISTRAAAAHGSTASAPVDAFEHPIERCVRACQTGWQDAQERWHRVLRSLELEDESDDTAALTPNAPAPARPGGTPTASSDLAGTDPESVLGGGASSATDAAGVPRGLGEDAPSAVVDPTLAVFQAVARDGDAMSRAELEGCLVALGMRKGVLALALEPVREVEAAALLSLSTWWSHLNLRSQIVVRSKALGFGDAAQPVLALACTCASRARHGGRNELSSVELRAALEAIGFDGVELAQLLESPASATGLALGEWCVNGRVCEWAHA